MTSLKVRRALRRSRRALARADGSPRRERAIITAYDRLVAAEAEDRRGQ